MEKIKIYLDTNTIIDFFINEAIKLKHHKEIELPRKLKFFMENSDRIEFLTSFLTEAEVVREMVSAFGMNSDKVEEVWADFLKFMSCKNIKSFNFDRKVVKLCSKIPMKLRTLINFLHLYIAMEEDAYFLTGDKNLLNIARENKIYDKTLNYIELRKKLSKLS